MTALSKQFPFQDILCLICAALVFFDIVSLDNANPGLGEELLGRLIEDVQSLDLTFQLLIYMQDVS